MGSYSSREKGEVKQTDEIIQYCSNFSDYMTKKGFTNFKDLTKVQIDTISEIYTSLTTSNISKNIRRAIEHSKSSIRICYFQLDFQRDDKDMDILQDHEYRLLVGHILKQQCPLISNMAKSFTPVGRSSSLTQCRQRIHKKTVIISWDEIDIKKQDIIRCREHTHTYFRWSHCKTTEDVIVYQGLVNLRTIQLREVAEAACEEMGASTVDIKTPAWDGVIPKFSNTDSDFENLRCSDYSNMKADDTPK